MKILLSIYVFCLICVSNSTSISFLSSDVEGAKAAVFTGDLPVNDAHLDFGNDLIQTPCKVERWNQKTMETVPHEHLHRKWVQQDKGNYTNLQWSQLRMLAAFVYRHEIVVTTTCQSLFGKPVYCRYYDCHRNELNNTVWETIMFPISAAFCARRADALFVSLSTKPNGEILGEPVPLVNRIAEDYAHEISVCVGPIYGSESRWLEIAETTEHHLLIGINHFYYTIFDKMHEYTRKLVDEYERLGYFDVVTIQNEYSTVDWMSHLLQINDCHFRSRFHSKWVLNIDIDERLVMLKTPLPSLLNSLDPDVGEVLFSVTRVRRNRILPKRYSGRKELLNQLEYLQYNLTLKTTWDVPKVIFKPEKIASLFYHWSFTQYPNTKIRTISKEIAYVRHYRTILPSLLGIWYMNRTFTVTRMDKALEDKVTEAVGVRLDSVYKQRGIRCEEIRKDLLGHFSKDNYNCTYGNGERYESVH